MADLDKMISDDSDDDEFGLDRAIGSIEVENNSEQDQPVSKPEVGITQSIDEIINDFPGVIVKQNNFMKNNFMKDLELDINIIDD